MVSGKSAVDILLITADRRGAIALKDVEWGYWFGGCLVESSMFLGG